MKCFFIVIASILIVGCGGTQPPISLNSESSPTSLNDFVDKTKYHLMFHADQEVSFLGQIDTSGPGGFAGGMAYPGYNAGSFLAGILVHAAIQGGVESSRKRKQQDYANQVWEPYQSVISNINGAMLHPSPLPIPDHDVTVLSIVDVLPDRSYKIKTSPLFLMSPKADSLILVNRIEFIEPNLDQKERLAKKNRSNSSRKKNVQAKSAGFIVEYVVSPEMLDEPIDHWMKGDGAELNSTLVNMFQESIKLAFLYNDKHLLTKPVTIRYLSGGGKKVERGEVVASTCERLIFITIKGGIKSVPTLKSADDCGVQ